MTINPSLPVYVLVKLDMEAKNGEEVFFLKVTTYPASFDAEDIRFHIEERTCPINVVPVAVIATRKANGKLNGDPHGIFKYINHITVEEGNKIIYADDKENPQTDENERLIHHLLYKWQLARKAAEEAEAAELQKWMMEQSGVTTIPVPPTQ